MVIICAVDQGWNIGYRGDMLCKISGDLKRFKRLTTGNIIIMGRKTFESLPGGKVLPERTNVVLTRNKDYAPDHTMVVHSLKELFALLEKINPKGTQTNFVIGGGDVVRELLPYCNKAYITKILKRFEKADTSIPNLDLESRWRLEEETEEFAENGLTYKYASYIQSPIYPGSSTAL